MNEIKSEFTENFIIANEISRKDFKGWVVSQGMLYKSPRIWWGKYSKRKQPHEGLDLAYYLNGNDEIIGLNNAPMIPATFTGIVVGVFDDFLGQSLFLKHNSFDQAGRQFCTIMGHIEPEKDISAGKTVHAGDVVGKIAIIEKSGIRPHIHISIGWVQKTITPKLLDWSNIANQTMMELIDPLDVLANGKIICIDNDVLSVETI